MYHRRKHYTIPVFVPELACPFQCAFCNQKKISGQQHIPDLDEINETIVSHLNSFKEKSRWVEVGFFGGNFTGIPLDLQQQYLSVVKPFLKNRRIQGIRLSTRPDYITQATLDFLKKHQVGTIELGVQSMDDEVLQASRRGHKASQTIQAARLIKENGFSLGLQMMVGLPKDNLEKSLDTAQQIIALGATSTRIYPALVIKDTLMHQWYERGEYRPLPLETAVEWVKHLIPIFEKAGTKIIKVGLHPSEAFTTGDELVAGPYHPSFRELVLSALWKDKFQALLEHPPSAKLLLFVPEKEINHARGYEAKNKRMLQSHFSSVKFYPDARLKPRSYRYEIG